MVNLPPAEYPHRGAYVVVALACAALAYLVGRFHGRPINVAMAVANAQAVAAADALAVAEGGNATADARQVVYVDLSGRQLPFDPTSAPPAPIAASLSGVAVGSSHVHDQAAALGAASTVPQVAGNSWLEAIVAPLDDDVTGQGSPVASESPTGPAQRVAATAVRKSVPNNSHASIEGWSTEIRAQTSEISEELGAWEVPS